MNTAYLFWHNEMTILKVCKPNNFKSHYFLKLTFPRIGALCSNFIGCDSYLGFNPPNFLALCGTNLEDSIGISNFTVTGSYAWSCSFGNLYKKLRGFFFLFATGFISFSVFSFPVLTISSLCTVLDPK